MKNLDEKLLAWLLQKYRYILWDGGLSIPYCSNPDGYSENDVVQAATDFLKKLFSGEIDPTVMKGKIAKSYRKEIEKYLQ